MNVNKMRIAQIRQEEGQKIYTKKKHTYTHTKKNLQIDMSVKKYCAFGCPVYTVYNIQSSCMNKKGVCTLDVELFNGSRRIFGVKWK